MEKAVFPYDLWIKWSSKIVLWPCSNFHHWIVTGLISAFTVSFHLSMTQKNYSSQNFKIWIVLDQKLMNFLREPVPEKLCRAAHHSVWRILRAWCYLSAPCLSFHFWQWCLLWPMDILVSDNYTPFICQVQKRQ